jgi:hypothetical protein
MFKRLFFPLVSTALFIACAGEVHKDTKAEVAQSIADGETVDGDVCVSNGWSEDGVCDSFCPDGDTTDCSGDEVVCDAFLEESNGVCSRDEADPCRSQDPDCQIECPAIYEEPDGECNEDPSDPCPTDPDCVACAEFIEEPNGVCERSDNDPCRFQDPDCDQACPAIAEEPDGVCNEEPGIPCPLDPDCPWNQ